MPSCVWVRVPSLALKKAVEHSTAFFVRASVLAASLPSVTGVTSPQGEFTSPTFGRSHFHRTDGDDSTASFCARASGLPASLPSVTGGTSSQGEYTSLTFGRSHFHRTADGSLDHFFCASFGRTPNEGGGLLPPGCATLILLAISDLGIFRVVKTATLISVKQLIHNNLQVAAQLRRHWRTSSGQMCRTAESTSKRNRGDAYHIVAALSQEQKSTTQPSMVLVMVDMFTPIFTSLFPSSKRYGII